MKKQVELSITHNGKDVVVYPYSKKEHVQFENGMNIDEFVGQDIATPTITHDTTAIKVGVGDSDVSGSVVDGTVNMTIKGQTYQNILPEPSLRNKMIGKSMQRLNEGYDDIEVVDGVSKSAILTGQTLINYCPDSIYTNQGWNGGMYKTFNDFPLLVKGKKYTIYAPLGDKTGNPSDALVNLYVKNGESETRIYKTYSNGHDTIHKTFTMGDVLEFNNYSITEERFKQNYPNVMILEGEWNLHDIPNYFKGMVSCKMPVLHTIGKNLLDFERTQSGYLGGNPHGLNAPDHSNKTSDYIRVKPNTTYTYSFNGFTASQVGSEYWTGWYYYTSPTEVSKKNMNRQVSRGSADTFKTVTFTTPSDCYYVRIGSRGLALDGATVQLEEGSTTTSYEPYKSNILHTPEEVVLRSLPNGVKDTLNLMTGEYVKRIGEIVLDGVSTHLYDSQVGGNETLTYRVMTDMIVKEGAEQCLADAFPSNVGNENGNGTEGVRIIGNRLYLYIYKTRLSNPSQSGVMEYLKSNPMKVQYPMSQEVVKTVDLSTSGNWEKIVLDGSEDWGADGNHYCFCRNLQINSACAFTDSIPVLPTKTDSLPSHASFSGARYFTVLIDGILNDPTKLKQYLRQNPLTVWYQTATHQDSTQVKQPIFFKDGYIQLSSGTDNSLIPTLDYQAKTSNSYVMDLMKTNTKYTMKAKSASGTFTIDGTSYGAGANGTFTTPTSMTNKLLVMSNKTNEEVMILEGDVTSKAIPYFKGIKSAFEDESKIEVLSTGKNLFDGAFEKGIVDFNGNLGYSPSAIRTVNYISVKPNASYHINLPNLEPFESFRVVYVHEYDENFKVLGEKQVGNRNIYTSKSATKFIKINTHTAHDLPVDSKMIVCENSTLDKQYEPYKSNSTKIPLLSPLRSLPDGTCDELIIDRESNKVKIIQRVGELDFSNLQYNTWNVSDSTLSKTVRFTWLSSNMSFYKVKDSSDGICDSIPYIRYNSSDTEHCRFDGSNPSAFMIWVDKSKLTSFDDEGLKKYLSTLPSTRVQYELATPVITEVDLEGFPYIYKDGHIFLNSEIAPTTQITYNINQSHQIESANENLQRHEKEISRLQKLIAQYIQVEYESTLLSLKI